MIKFEILKLFSQKDKTAKRDEDIMKMLKSTGQFIENSNNW